MKRRADTTDWLEYFAPRFLILSVAVGLILRVVLLFSPLTVASFTLGQWLAVFGLGFLCDVAFASCAFALSLLVYGGVGEGKYCRPWCFLIEAGMIAFAYYVFFSHSVFHEYGAGLPMIAKTYVCWKLISFNLRLLFPRLRSPWRHAVLGLTMLTYVFCVLLNAVSEYFFWNEFGVRYNFIAVAYLVYTNEVIGNIFESYPVIPLFLLVFLVAIAVTLLFLRPLWHRTVGVGSMTQYVRGILLTLLMGFLGAAFLHHSYRNWQTDNAFATQLSQNGCYDFIEAFMNNELDYSQFYPLLPEDEAREGLRQLLHMNADGVQPVFHDETPPIRKNIVLITVESLSADFLFTYGNTESLTPNLDSLMQQSLVFDNMFAAGNRTVRGLEAVTLCLPPSAGESIVKRPDNGGLFSTGALLKSMGYAVHYIYGGDSYFDNMGDFFGKNGYQVIDRNSLASDEITFQNIWGVCDEDTYRLALRVCDGSHRTGKPFFTHIMTVSNHRPFTYPEGRISIDGDPQSRAGGVKYTDYAIGNFLRMARETSWFSETVFVIVADHCASSAGRTNLPLEKYHIPALVYSPGFIEPRRVATPCSQIDLMPTVFSLLRLSYDSRFYGQDILGEGFVPRAFVATYQDLGYYCDGILTVLSPVRSVRQYRCQRNADGTYDEQPLRNHEERYVREAQIYYQNANKKGNKPE